MEKAKAKAKRNDEYLNWLIPLILGVAVVGAFVIQLVLHH